MEELGQGEKIACLPFYKLFQKCAELLNLIFKNAMV